MVVESESSLAEGRLESRRAAVEEILSRLTLSDFIPTAVASDEAAQLAGQKSNES
jgi:hypothetical protein